MITCPTCQMKGEPVGKPTTHFLHINRHFLCRVPQLYIDAADQLGGDSVAADLCESLRQMQRGETVEV